MRRRSRMALLVLLASLGAALYLLRPARSPGPVTIHLPSFPSQVVADERAARVLVLSNYDSPGPIGSAWNGGSVRLLDAADGRQLQVLRMGVPLSAIADPRTGRAFVVSSGAPSGRGSSGGTYLQLIDPTRGVLVRTITLAAPVPFIAPRSFQVTVPPVAAATPAFTQAIPIVRAVPQLPGDPTSPARAAARADGQRGSAGNAAVHGGAAHAEHLGGAAAGGSAIGRGAAHAGRHDTAAAGGWWEGAGAPDAQPASIRRHDTGTAGRGTGRRGAARAGERIPGLDTSPARAALPTATVVGSLGPATAPTLPTGTPKLLGTNGGGFHRPGGSPVPAATSRAAYAGMSGVGLAIDDPLRRVFVLSKVAGPGFISLLSVVDADSGALLRSLPLSFAGAALAVDVRSGRLFIADVADQSVQVYDARTLHPLARAPAGCGPAEMAIDETAGRAYALCSGPSGSTVVSLDSSNGQRLNGVPIGANGMHLLVDSARGRLYAVSAGSFLGGRLGAARIAILDARSGALVRAVDIGPIIPQVAIEPLHGYLYVAGTDPRTNRGVLLVLDATRGSVRVRLALGPGTTDLAVDTRQHRLFVAGASVPGPVQDAGRWGALVDRLRSFFGQQVGLPALSGPGIDGPGGAITVIDTAQ